MRKLIALAALGLGVLFTSCDTLNVGGPYPTFGPRITSFTVDNPNELFGLGTGNFHVTFAGGTAPYQVSIDFAGAAPNFGPVAAASAGTVDASVTFNDRDAAQSFTATATVSDANGTSNGTATLTFEVKPTQNQAPVITGIAVAGSTVTVSVTDEDGDDVTVTLDSVSSTTISGSPASRTVAGGNGDAVFNFSRTDPFTAGSGTATFTADDGSATDTDTSGTISIDALVIPADALGAIPLVTSAGVADTVKVVVATGALANPFQFMTGVSVVFPSGCDYDANSYDYGAPVAGDPGLNPEAAKDQETVDGIWTTVNPAAGFLGVGDNLLLPDTALPDPFTGSSARDFNITPLGGSDAPAGTSGILFNFNLGFSTAGSYSLDFLLFDETNRTYYQDGSQAIYQWGDISNDIVGNTVEVS